MQKTLERAIEGLVADAAQSGGILSVGEAARMLKDRFPRSRPSGRDIADALLKEAIRLRIPVQLTPAD